MLCWARACCCDFAGSQNKCDECDSFIHSVLYCYCLLCMCHVCPPHIAYFVLCFMFVTLYHFVSFCTVYIVLHPLGSSSFRLLLVRSHLFHSTYTRTLFFSLPRCWCCSYRISSYKVEFFNIINIYRWFSIFRFDSFRFILLFFFRSFEYLMQQCELRSAPLFDISKTWHINEVILYYDQLPFNLFIINNEILKMAKPFYEKGTAKPQNLFAFFFAI